ncbi:SidA/IucD/PvdA family monooxygenase [Streptomyces sp. SS7]|uniref:SidA/IucD/PvdA family monooxygenase n=1 Tax=Streptomyces sp. SS7 TaxID=3108485 RepID=UPI0030EB1E4C
MTGAEALDAAPHTPVHDILGVGFGPSDPALAIAVREHNEQVPDTDRLGIVFVEKQDRFGWHRGMPTDGATRQVSLNDLATMRNPGSWYGFPACLHDERRLSDFINDRSFFPSRAEFHDHLEWAAVDFTDQVAYGENAESVSPSRSGDELLFAAP